MYQREWIGIILTALAIGFVVYANLATANQHKKKVEDKIEPISQPVDTIIYETDDMIYWEWDSYMDSIDMECGDTI